MKMKFLKKLNIGKWLRRTRLSNKLYYYTIIVVIFAVFGSIVFWQLTHPTGSKAAWFDENYLYRQPVNVTQASASALLDFQVALTVDTATLISAGKMRRDCNDIRITDQGGNQLPFWVEEGSADCNSASTKIWTKASSIATSGATLFFYYGNQQAASASSGLTTFDFFDNFDKGQLDNSKWGVTGATSYSGGNLNITTGSVYTQNTVAGQPNEKVEARLQWTNNSGNWGGISIANAQSTQTSNAGSNKLAYMMRGTTTRGVVGYAADGTAASYNITSGTSQFTSSDNTSYILGYAVSPTNVIFYNNRTQTNSYSGTWTAPYYIYLGYHLGSAGSTSDIQDISVDWVLSRKYTATEPTVSFGTEENSPSPVAYWKFDEGTGNVASSAASPSFPAQIQGASWSAQMSCVSVNCLYFDGINDYAAVNGNVNLSNTNVITVSFWMKWITFANDDHVAMEFSPNFNNSTGGFVIGPDSSNGGKFQVGVKGDVGYNTAEFARPTASVWHYYTFVLNKSAAGASEVVPYVDGLAISYTKLNSNDNSNNFGNLPLYFMSRAGGSLFANGYLDEVKIYPFALSAAQVKANFVSRGSLIGSGAVLGATQNSVLSNGLVGYWKMDEASWNGTSGEVIDSSGNSNNGTSVSGAEATPSAKFGNAGYFAGVDEYVSLPNDLRKTDTVGTLQAWVRFTGNGSANSVNPIISLGGSGSSAYVFALRRFETSSGCGTNKLELRVLGTGINNDVCGSTTLNDNTWYHVAVVSNGSSYTMYVNGNAETITMSLGSNNGKWLGDIGLGATTSVADIARLYYNSAVFSYGKGNFDDVRIYNRALNPMEVQQLYNFAPGPVGYWNFEAGQGNVVNDSSTYGNNGAWVGGTATKWVSGKYGKGGNFSGVVNETVAIGSQTNFNFERTNSFSIGAWVNKTGSVAYLPIFNKTLNNVSQAGYIFTIRDTGVLRAQLINTTTPSNYIDVIGTKIVNDGKWHYVAMNYDGTSLANGVTFYVDGVKDTASILTDTLSGTLLNSLTPYIGSRNNTDLWGIGKLDEVRVYNYTRTPAQIMSDMNAGAPGVTASGKNTIGYWDFDDGYGNVASNSGILGASANGSLFNFNNPAVSTSGWSQDGKFGKALAFDGTNDYVSAGNITKFDGGSGLAYSAWFKLGALSTNKILVARWESNQHQILFQTDNSSSSDLRLFIADSLTDAGVNFGNTSGLNLVAGNWYHIVVIYEGGQGTNALKLKLYINGVQKTLTFTGTIPSTLTTPSVATNLNFGANIVNGRYFNGIMDEVKIYNYPLTAQDVKAEYNHGSSLVLGAAGTDSSGNASNSASTYYCVPGSSDTCRSPIGEWLMEEHQGLVTNDTSGNGFSGTLINTPVWARGKVGGALDFTATTPYVSFGANKVGPKASGASAVTMSAWVNATAYPSARGRIFSAYDNGANTGFALSYNTTNIEVGGRAALADAFTNTTVVAPALNGWHYLTGILDFANNKIYIYIDGVLAKTTTVSFGSTTYVQGTGTTVDVINLPPGEHLAAFIDQVRVYDYARSQAQIAYEYNQGKPVAYYDFDECEGPTAHEYYNSTASGTIQIGPSGTQTTVGTCQAVNTAAAWYNGRSGKFNYSLNFDGTDDFVSFLNASYLSPGTGDMTISSWVYPDLVNGVQRRIYNDYGSNGNNLVATFLNTDNKFHAYFRDSAGVAIEAISGNTATANTWYHVVGVKSGTTARIYINGVLSGTYTDGTLGAITVSDGLVPEVGRNPVTNANFFSGKVDDVQIFNYPLTAVQVRGVYNQNSAVRFGPLTGAP